MINGDLNTSACYHSYFSSCVVLVETIHVSILVWPERESNQWLSVKHKKIIGSRMAVTHHVVQFSAAGVVHELPVK